MILKNLRFVIIGMSLIMTSCLKDENIEPKDKNNNPDVSINTPASYEFLRNGQSSVAYTGQIERLDQLAEIKSLLSTANSGSIVYAQDLKHMFANTNGNGNGNFSFSSTKQLKNKTFDLDISYFENMFDSVETASINASNSVLAQDGTAGLIERSNGSKILVDANGREFTQIVEKGLMGATFYNQIVNTYLTDSRIGDHVNNTDLVSGKNYTQMEHHMDEAFGYFGAPEDFKSNYSGSGNVRYWANYSNTADDELQMNDRLMNAYKRARAAIAENKLSIKDVEVEKIYMEFEKLIAASAIHYANQAKAATVDGDRLHVLSECYAFTRALRYSNIDHMKLSQNEINDLLENKIGNNFWLTTESNLNLLIDKLSSTYNLDSVKNQL